MKLNVKKVTSVTLLASMMLTTVSPPLMPVLAQETETEVAASIGVETEGFETEGLETEDIGFEECLEETVMLAAMSAEASEPVTEIQDSLPAPKMLSESTEETEFDTEASTSFESEESHIEEETSVPELKEEKETKPESGKKENQTKMLNSILNGAATAQSLQIKISI